MVNHLAHFHPFYSNSFLPDDGDATNLNNDDQERIQNKSKATMLS